MRAVGVRLFLIGAVLAAELLALPAIAAPPICGRKACREEINACVESDCAGLKGSARSRCKKACVRDVRSACDADPTVCNPSVTTTTGATTSSAPATTSSSSSSSTPTTSSTTTTVIGSPSGGFVD